jgi:hypothetical protein
VRKLAREAVVVVLIGVPLLFIGGFIYFQYIEGRASAISENLFSAGIGSVYFGVPVFLGLWFLYRLIRFAVKG